MLFMLIFVAILSNEHFKSKVVFVEFWPSSKETMRKVLLVLDSAQKPNKCGFRSSDSDPKCGSSDPLKAKGSFFQIGSFYFKASVSLLRSFLWNENPHLACMKLIIILMCCSERQWVSSQAVWFQLSLLFLCDMVVIKKQKKENHISCCFTVNTGKN